MGAITNLRKTVTDAIKEFGNIPVYLSNTVARVPSQRGYGKQDAPLFPMVITKEERNRLYRRNGLLRRIIKKQNEDCFSKYFHIRSDNKKFEEAASELCKKLRISEKLKKAGIFSSKDGYSLILIRFDDRGNWEQEVQNPRGVKYLKVIPSHFVKEYEMAKHPLDPSLRCVESWTIKGFGENDEERKVHYSRVLHISQEMDEVDSPAGLSTIDILYNTFFILENETWAFGQMAYRMGGGFPKFMVSDPNDPDVQALKEDYPSWHAIRGFICDENIIKDVKFEGAEGKALNPPDFINPTLTLLCAECGIPRPILLGVEAGAVTGSEQNVRSYATEIKSVQMNFWEPIIRNFIDQMIDFKILPDPGKEYSIEFEDIVEEGEKEKAERIELIAKALSKMTDFLTINELRKLLMDLNVTELEELEEETGKIIIGVEKLKKNLSSENGEPDRD